MQLSITFPGTDFPDVLFTVTDKSLVKEAVGAACDEWGTDALFLQLWFSGELLSPTSLLLSHGVEADSQLTVSLLRWVTKDLLVDEGRREKVGSLIIKKEKEEQKQEDQDQTLLLRLDTPTFVDDDGLLSFQNSWVPENNGRVQSICFGKPDVSVSSVADDFLAGSTITSVDLIGLQYVKKISDNFLQETSLTTLDLSTLVSVESIGDRFLHLNTSLVTVNLCGMRKVTRVGYNFLYGCELLKTVCLCNFQNLTHIEYFLAACPSLETISNISGLKNAESIGDGFLSSCIALVSVDLTVLTNVTAIGDDFLWGCSSLQSLDTSALEKVTEIGDSFLRGCTSLETISNISGLKNAESIGDDFLANCSSLVSVDSVEGNEYLSEKVSQRKS